MTAARWIAPLLLFGLASASAGETPGTKLASEIASKGYSRVGVLPRFLARVPGGEEALGGSIGPQADLFAEELEDALTTAAAGRFQIVPGRNMKKAFDGLAIEDLSDKAKLAQVASKVDGLDALVVGSVVDEREADEGGKVGGLNVRCQLIALKDGSVAGVVREKVGPTLSDGAYMGESWEIRRWTDAGLTNVGLDLPPGAPPENAFGMGAEYEKQHYAMVRRGQPHPLLDPQFPFAVDILVDGQPRKPLAVGDKLYVTLDPGENYQIALRNQCPRAVYAAVFVDGINILGKTRESPASCRRWNLAAGSKGLFKGWFSGDNGQFTEEEFEIKQADDTVAFGQGFSDNLGMITVVSYTIGLKDVPEVPTFKAMSVGGTFGTGVSGRSSQKTLEMKAGDPPGPILAAVTIHYATSAQIKKLQAPNAPTAN